MEGLGFILLRFSYSLFSGCIINFFILLNYFVLVKNNILPKNLFEGISLPYSFSFLIFIITAVIFSIYTEGLCELVFDKYKELDIENKIWKPKIFKPNEKRRTFFGFLRWNINRKFTIVEACSYLSKENSNDGEAMRKLMRDTDCKIPYEAVYIGAKRIIKEEKSQNIYHFRDISFILQLLRVTFSLVASFSCIAGIVFLVLWLYKENNTYKIISIFYMVSFCVSTIANLPINPIAIYFSKRYARDVWRTYKAIIEKDNKDDPNNKQTKE